MFTVKKLKIVGFKSFAYPTELLIEEGVTGIIGPNGCGKSNIFEAIRWVMGESSSKSLRSGSMDEVIFNGTSSLPAKNFAEVSIELDNFTGEITNIDSSEKKIIISRMLERGVGSFYKINNKDVRAKDVNLLFSDSGSGPRSSSIISQGNIDQVINFKPIERKIILEDAAGISGLQARRHESELKLQSTELNLEKIDINLNNLNEQKKNLTRQARQAERYENISESIKYYQSLLIFVEWKSLIENIKNFQQKMIIASRSLQNLISESNKEKTGIEEKEGMASNAQKKKDLLNQKIYQISTEKNNFQNKLDGIKAKKEEIKRFLITIKNDKEIEDKKLKEIENYINELENKIESSDGIKENKTRLVKLDLEENKLKNELKNLETEFVNEIQLSLGEEFKSGNLKENKEELNENELKISAEIQNNNNKIINDEKILNLDKKNSLSIEKENKQIEKKLADIKRNIVSINNQKVQKKSSINDLNDKIEELLKKLTQFQTEIITLKKISGQMNLSKESIVNLLKIKKGYENAVYAALMNELDATLNKSPKRWMSVKVVDVNPIENSILNYVTAPKELELILSQIGFVDESSNPAELQKKLNIGQILVDIKGNIWRWDGFVSEDNLQKKNIIDSQLRINSLISEAKNLEEKLQQMKQKKIDEIEEERTIFEIENSENKNLENFYKNLDIKLTRLSELREKTSISKNNIEKIKEKNEFLQNQRKKIQNQLEIIKEKEMLFEKSETQKSKSDKELVQKNIGILDNKVEEKRNEISNLKEMIMKKEINRTFNLNDLKKSNERKIECLKQIKILEHRENQYLNEDKNLDSLPVELQKNIDNLNGQKNKIEKDLMQNDQNLNEINQQLQKCQENLNKVEKGRENKKNEIVVMESSLGNSKLKEKELRNLIFQKSSMQPEELEKDPKISENKIKDEVSINKMIEKLNYQREQMGPVNLRARIEEKEIIEIVDNLELEKNDLVQAINKLRIGINKINFEGKNRLVKAFESVNKNFSDLFKKLFNGGEAKLELIKSEDPLHTGLEIYARPPGKKLSSISLLSGGEKTLTAIALIFSIFLINPSPICILDEVDAALDDLNVEKFCKILAELKNNTKTRFLIITHHKITMSSIDRVYGVTMAQKGISDIVSVDFNKDNFKEAV